MSTTEQNAYILAAGADPAHIRNDRDSLRSAGEGNVRARLSGRSALELVHESRPKLVICDLDLGDMRAPEFIRALRGSDSPPVMAVSADKSRRTLLDCIGAGCAAYLLRPYSTDAFTRQLSLVRQGVELKQRLGDRIRELAAQEEQAVRLEKEQKLNKPEQFYRLGCRHMSRRRYDDAILSFTRAVSLQSLYAEAYVGLAKAWRAKGRPEKFDAFMHKAAQAYAALERYHEARELFTRVLKNNPKAENPFLEIGFKMIQRGDFENAARTYHQADFFKPGTNIYRELARACHFTGDPQAAARCVSETLAEQPDRPEASGIFERIMGGPWRPASSMHPAESRRRFLIPDRLHELWLVVRFTWQVYRNGGPLALEA